MSAGETLRRLLTLLPLAAREEGVELDEAARATSVDVDRVMADLEVLTNRSYYLPAGSASDMQIHIDGTRIRVTGPNPFARPMRLTRGELLALSVALRVAEVASNEAKRICAEIERELAAGPSARPEPTIDLSDVVSHMASELGVESRSSVGLGPPARDHVVPDDLVALHDMERDADGVRDTFSTAVLARRAVTFAYLKPNAEKHEVRTLEPYRLLHAEGEWYVVGRDPEKDELRLFRLDRVLGAMLRDAPFEPDPDFDVGALVQDGQVALLADDAEPDEVAVRYTPLVAPWVAERWAGREDGDGAYVVTHPVYEARWLMRTVMRYGGEAAVADG